VRTHDNNTIPFIHDANNKMVDKTGEKWMIRRRTNEVCKKCGNFIYYCSEVSGSITTSHGELLGGSKWLECSCGYSNESLGGLQE
jgi:hypothetical protein